MVEKRKVAGTKVAGTKVAGTKVAGTKVATGTKVNVAKAIKRIKYSHTLYQYQYQYQ
jgi:hypothetical protein